MKTLRRLLLVAMSIGMVMANGLSLNNPGPRALGMAGAYVAFTPDASAIYWNPAGLAYQSSSLHVSGTAIMPFAKYTPWAGAYGDEIQSKDKTYPAGNLFFNYKLNNDMALGLGVYVPAGLGISWNPSDLGVPGDYNLLSQIGAVSISPTFAYRVNDDLAVGVAVNVLYALFDLEQPVNSGMNFAQFVEESSGIGVGASLGAQYKVNDQLDLGLSLRLSTTVAMSGEAKNPLFAAFGAPKSDFDRDVTWPLWIGAGAAYHVNDQLTLAFDLHYSKWSELDELPTEYKNEIWAANVPEEESTFTLNWDDALQIRFGGEYHLNEMFDIRAGYAYDPAPAPDETVIILFPSMTNHMFCVGGSFKGESFIVDLGIEYLLSSERDITEVSDYNQPGKHSMNVLAISAGFGYNF
jgi:long-chain fatty acid transport protein